MKIALIQLTSVLDPQENLREISKYIISAKSEGAEYIFLPEVFYSMSDSNSATPFLIEDGNEHHKNILRLASDNGVYLLGGSAATKIGDKVINRIYNIDPNGNELLGYDKINLFACDLSRHSSGQVIDEADVYTAGNEPRILELNDWKIGLSLCFDVRFPEMYRDYARKGCQLMSVASAFSQPTGKAHWNTLVRARAIETQSYVVASGQVGVHNEKIKTFGHSLVVDPWGDILVELGEEPGYAVVELSKKRVEAIRKRMNVL